MAIRFVDLGRQIDPQRRMFGFWKIGDHEYVSGFIQMNFVESWAVWSDFYADFEREHAGFDPPKPGETAEDYLLLCPDWVFANPDREAKTPKHLSMLLRHAGDFCEEHGQYGMAEGLRDAVAWVEELEAKTKEKGSVQTVPISELVNQQQSRRTADRRSLFSVPPIDLGEQIERAIRHERDQIEAFLAECVTLHNATPETHDHVVYPPPDEIQGRVGDRIHVLIPREDLKNGEPYPTREEACRRYPNRRIFVEYNMRRGDDPAI